MKTKIEIPPNHKKNVIPKVGQPWRHTNSSTVYMRICDEHGAAAIKKSVKPESHFFSVDLQSGFIAHTLVGCGNIELLMLRDETFIPA